MQWQAVTVLSLYLFLFHSLFLFLVLRLSWVVSPINTFLDTDPASTPTPGSSTPTPLAQSIRTISIIKDVVAMVLAMTIFPFPFACGLRNLVDGMWHVE